MDQGTARDAPLVYIYIPPLASTIYSLDPFSPNLLPSFPLLSFPPPPPIRYDSTAKLYTRVTTTLHGERSIEGTTLPLPPISSRLVSIADIRVIQIVRIDRREWTNCFSYFFPSHSLLQQISVETCRRTFGLAPPIDRLAGHKSGERFTRNSIFFRLDFVPLFFSSPPPPFCSQMCNEWAIDTPCPAGGRDFCRSLHILDSRGNSVLASKFSFLSLTHTTLSTRARRGD